MSKYYLYGDNWRDRKLQYIRHMYEDKANQWRDNCIDDRCHFCNMFNYVIEAICSLPKEPHAFVCVAMNNKIDEYTKTMDDIIERFKDR